MKKFLLNLSLIVAVSLISLKMAAQSFSANYNFQGVVSGQNGRIDPTPVPTATGVTFGSFSAVGNMSANPNAGKRFSFTGWPLGATNGSDVFTGSLDATQYYEVTITPAPYYSIELTSIVFTVQRSSTGIRQYAVRSSVDGYANNLPASIDPANVNLSVVDVNVFQIADAATSAQGGSKVTLSNDFTGITTPVTFRFYGFNTEASGGTFSLNSVTFDGSATISPTAPNIIINPTSLSFASVQANTVSGPLTFTVEGDNLTDPVTLTTSAPFSLSDAENGSYSTTLSLNPGDVTSAKTIYVKFSPDTVGGYNGTISLSSTDAITQTLNLLGQAIDPANLTFDFNSCVNTGVPGEGWTTYSVEGPSQTWTCTTFGRNMTNGVNINGYSGGPVENEDWLISPPLEISTMSLPVLRFWSRGEFSGPGLQLWVSTDYTGTGDPHNATWTNLNAYFPPLTNTWTMTDGINLSAYRSVSKVYVAFEYVSNPDEGAARWTLDDVDVTDRTSLLTVTPPSLSLGEAPSGDFSNGLRFNLQAFGYGDLTVTAPDQFQVSTDSLSGYTASLSVTETEAQSGVSLFARFAPTSKALLVQGRINIVGTGLDSNTVNLVATSYPKSETLDVGCYNLSFFGNNATNNPTLDKIATQRENISTILNHLSLDIVGVEEISNDTAFANLVASVPNAQSVVSPRWSHSFEAPDPNFPAQKTGFIFNSSTVTLLSSRDMFSNLFDAVLAGNKNLLPNYPGGDPTMFWASGRLPFMATFAVNIGGNKDTVIVVDIHAKSSSDQASYNRRVYDAHVLFDSLSTHYPDKKVILVGDYNDRVFGTIYGGGGGSPYKDFLNNNFDSVLTYPLDSAGYISFLSGSGMIDHISISDLLLNQYISNSVAIEDPRSYIANYNSTTASDHFPVYSRYVILSATPVGLINFNAVKNNQVADLSWQTTQEKNTKEFVIERSIDGVHFTRIGIVNAVGNSGIVTNYHFTDTHPENGVNFYHLRNIDLDGTTAFSNVVKVLFAENFTLTITPNPARTSITVRMNNQPGLMNLQITDMSGRTVHKQAISNQTTTIDVSGLSKGLYMVRISGNAVSQSSKLIIE